MITDSQSFGQIMFGCQCLYWNRLNHLFPPEPEPFSLPAPIPEWPPGEGFASGKISIGEIEVLKITRFELIWACTLPDDKKKCVAFYKPVEIPDGFHCVGYYSQDNGKPLHGYVLVAREVYFPETADVREERAKSPALIEPLDYALQWRSDEGNEESFGSCGYFWLPQPPEGYKAMGFLVTNKLGKPGLDEARCVRADLTDTCETYSLLLNTGIKTPSLPFQVWTTRPRYRGMMENGVSVGTFFCSSYWNIGDDLQIGCLKNLNPKLSGMPNLDQIHSLINHYGPTVFFHPEEVYLPSSVAWFFKKGALLYKKDLVDGEEIDESGSILPGGGSNDGEFWIDLPTGDQRNNVIHGNLESAKLYAHVKPALGGTFTDIAMWVFCPFNGPGTLKIGFMDIALSKVGQHVGDWEHFTLRICNFSGELCSIYFSQHSGGEWVDAYALEYIHGNKTIVYSTKNGHASFPHAGTYLQGSAALGIGIRNDAARSNFSVDSSIQYEVVAAEYLGDGVVTEPCWLQFMREWGPKIVYNSRTELEKVINLLPVMLKHPAKNIFAKLPVELSGEEGPTGPKEKNNWVGDERW